MTTTGLRTFTDLSTQHIVNIHVFAAFVIVARLQYKGNDTHTSTDIWPGALCSS